VRTSKINLEMESSVFNPRIFVGTIAAAGILAAGAATPAFAAGRPAEHQAKPIHIVRALPTIVPVPAAPNIPVIGGVMSGNPASGLLGALEGLPVAGPVFAALLGGPGDQNPVSGALHGLTAGSGLSSAVSGVGNAVGGTIDSVAKAVPGGNMVTGLLPGGSATGALNGLTSTLNGLTGGLSGLTNAVPALGSITGALPKAGG
jgi:hypothetical protein